MNDTEKICKFVEILLHNVLLMDEIYSQLQNKCDAPSSSFW